MDEIRGDYGACRVGDDDNGVRGVRRQLLRVAFAQRVEPSREIRGAAERYAQVAAEGERTRSQCTKGLDYEAAPAYGYCVAIADLQRRACPVSPTKGSRTSISILSSRARFAPT